MTFEQECEMEERMEKKMKQFYKKKMGKIDEMENITFNKQRRLNKQFMKIMLDKYCDNSFLFEHHLDSNFLNFLIKIKSRSFTKPIKTYKEGRVQLDISYQNKDKAKECGARWDGETRCWYVECSKLDYFNLTYYRTTSDQRNLEYVKNQIRYNKNYLEDKDDSNRFNFTSSEDYKKHIRKMKRQILLLILDKINLEQLIKNDDKSIEDYIRREYNFLTRTTYY